MMVMVMVKNQARCSGTVELKVIGPCGARDGAARNRPPANLYTINLNGLLNVEWLQNLLRAQPIHCQPWRASTYLVAVGARELQRKVAAGVQECWICAQLRLAWLFDIVN